VLVLCTTSVAGDARTDEVLRPAGWAIGVELPDSIVRARQVHGAAVAVVGPAGDLDGPQEADALVTRSQAIAITTIAADCAPLALGSPEGVVAVVHAGWRGLVAGVIEAAAATMRRLGASRLAALLGPCIGSCCYEFGDEALRLVVEQFGDDVTATSRTGRPSLDLARAVGRALERAEAELVGRVGTCTGCDRAGEDGAWRWFSERIRRERSRHAVVAWRPA
jgi:copper oxidase (laccase) domain-containing protein